MNEKDYISRSENHLKEPSKKKTILLKEIQRNSIKKQEVLKELEKDKEQAWKDDRIVYTEGKIYILNNQRIWEQIL